MVVAADFSHTGIIKIAVADNIIINLITLPLSFTIDPHLTATLFSCVCTPLSVTINEADFNEKSFITSFSKCCPLRHSVLASSPSSLLSTDLAKRFPLTSRTATVSLMLLKTPRPKNSRAAVAET